MWRDTLPALGFRLKRVADPAKNDEAPLDPTLSAVSVQVSYRP